MCATVALCRSELVSFAFYCGRLRVSHSELRLGTAGSRFAGSRLTSRVQSIDLPARTRSGRSPRERDRTGHRRDTYRRTAMATARWHEAHGRRRPAATRRRTSTDSRVPKHPTRCAHTSPTVTPLTPCPAPRGIQRAWTHALPLRLSNARWARVRRAPCDTPQLSGDLQVELGVITGGKIPSRRVCGDHSPDESPVGSPSA